MAILVTLLVIGVVVLLVVQNAGNGSGLFFRVIVIPEGADWRKFYRDARTGRAMPKWVWLVIGVSVGIAIIFGIMAVTQ